MRTFLTNLLAATIVVAGCQSIELSPYVTDIDNCTSSLSASTKVTPTHLAAYINGYKGIPKTRSADVLIDPILNGTDTVMYLVNYPEGGWEVLSADLRVPKVLVMCEGGSMTVEDLASNPAEEDLYGAMGDYISYLHDNPDLEVTDSLGNWSDVAHQTENMQTREIESWVLIGTTVLTDIEEKQDHLTETMWGQGYNNYLTGKWNMYAPRLSSSSSYRCYIGDIPVAIAQMLYYLHYKIGFPVSFYDDFRVATYIPENSSEVSINTYEIIGSASTSTDWDSMPLSAINPTIYSDYQYGLVSSLMVYIGYRTNAVYTPSKTVVSVSKIKPFFNEIGISCSNPSSLNWGIIEEQIFDYQMPVLLNVHATDGNSHYTIVDGMHYYLRETEKRYVWNSISGPQYKTEIETDSFDMVCFNWGAGVYGVYSDGQTVWYNIYALSWTLNDLSFIESNNMIYGFSIN